MESEMEDEDLHICGKCRLEFNTLNSFVQHKSNCSARQRPTVVTTTAISDVPSSVPATTLTDWKMTPSLGGQTMTTRTVADWKTPPYDGPIITTTTSTVAASTLASSAPFVTSGADVTAASGPPSKAEEEALVAAATLSDISAVEGLVEEEVEMQMDSADEQMAEETVETAEDDDDDEVHDGDDDEDDVRDGEALVAKVLGEEVRLGKREIFQDDDPRRGPTSHNIQVFDMPPLTGDEDQTMSVFSLDAEGNMIELPVKYPSEIRKPVTSEPHQVNESILDSSAFMPVTLGEVVAAPSNLDAGEAEDESSGMVPSLDVPVRLGPKIFPCSYDGCTYVTKYAKDLQRHLLVHTGEKPFVCGECKKAFNRIDKLKIHQRIHSGFKPFRCQFCDYACSERSAMRKHMRTHTDDRPFKCMICPYASRNSSQLVVHLRTHTGDAPFQCLICASKFKVNSDLKRHMRTHTGEKPFKCPHCDYRCSVKSNLKPHIQMNHEPTVLQKCLVPECGFETNTKGEFKAHQRTHSDYKQTIRPILLNCQLCNYKCSNKTNLAMHMQTDHSAEGKKTIQEVLENGPFICTFCTFTAKFQNNLRKHVRKNHPEAFQSGRLKKDAVGNADDNAAGTSTDAKNLTAAVLAAALRIKKGSIKQQQKAARNAAGTSPDKKPFSCSFCDKSFSRQDALDTHSKNRHPEQNQQPRFVVNGFVQQQPHDGVAHATIVDASQFQDAHRLSAGALSAEETTTTTIQTESGQFINVAVFNSDRNSAGSSAAQPGSIILAPMTGSDGVKSLQIIAPSHHALQHDPNVYESLLQQHPVEVQQQQQQHSHFAPNFVAVSGANGQHITLQPMAPAIPTSSANHATTHHLMEPAETATTLPIIQSADGQTHYLIIQSQ